MKHLQDMPPSIVKAIAEIQTSVSSVTRDGRNSHGGYDFASTDAIYAALSVKMGQAGLTMLTLEDEPEIKVIETTDAKGNPRRQQWGKFGFQFVLATEDGTWTDDRCKRSLYIQIMGAQTFMAAQSYAEKTFLRSLFKLPTGDLDLDALPGEGEPIRTSSAGAKREQVWEKFNNELEGALDLSTIHEIEGRYTAKMPKAWRDPMQDALASKRQTLLNGFE
jgi:hypothetical protein